MLFFLGHPLSKLSEYSWGQVPSGVFINGMDSIIQWYVCMFLRGRQGVCWTFTALLLAMEMYSGWLINWVVKKSSPPIGQSATVHICDWLTKVKQNYEASFLLVHGYSAMVFHEITSKEHIKKFNKCLP